MATNIKNIIICRLIFDEKKTKKYLNNSIQGILIDIKPIYMASFTKVTSSRLPKSKSMKYDFSLKAMGASYKRYRYLQSGSKSGSLLSMRTGFYVCLE